MFWTKCHIVLENWYFRRKRHISRECHILAVIKAWHGDNIFSTRLRYWNFQMFLKNIESFGANDDFDDISFLKLDFIIFGLQISFSSVKKNFFGHFEKFLLRYYPKTYQPRIGGQLLITVVIISDKIMPCFLGKYYFSGEMS